MLRLPALEIRQGTERVLYSFAVDGKLLPSFTTISRVHRDEGQEIRGYQRPEVISHVAEIRAYLESERPLIPNSVVVAFDHRVRFEPVDVPSAPADSRFGFLCIPVDPSLPDETKPGWVVDGQQRCAAIREARVERFPISVTAFITDDQHEQVEQFILVNATKPLPKGLIYELLPGTEARLPGALQRRRFPALLLERLNLDRDSPFRGMIQTPTNPEGVVKDNSILRMLENSLNEGALHRFRDPHTGRGNVDEMLAVLKAFWNAAAEVFPKAWAQKPRHSRLMHGVGIVAMGFVMDAIADRYLDTGPAEAAAFRADLAPLAEVCRWTSGHWDFPDTPRKWNDLQNTSRDIILLADYLLEQYRRRVWTPQRLQRVGVG